MNTENKDGLYSSEDFQAYFKTSTRSLIMRANPPHFTVLAVSDKYLALVHKQRSDVANKNLFEVFPGSPADPSGKNSVVNSFKRVIEHKKTDELPVFRYEVDNEETGTKETEYWTNVNEPIFDKEGNVAYIINTTTNITRSLLAEQALKEKSKLIKSLEREQVLNEELATSNEELRAVNEELHSSQERLFVLNNELEQRVERRTRQVKNSEIRFRSLVEQLPAAINVFLTDDLIVDLPNSQMLEIWGRTFSEVNGKPLTVAMPELEGQPFMQKLRGVISTGTAYSSTEEKAFILRNGHLDECYFNIVYQPIVNEDGTVTSLMQIASEVTEEVVARQKIQMLNEELAATNEELAAANEEQLAANEELMKTQYDLSIRNQQLKESEAWFRNLINQAPVAIALFRGPEFIIDLYNEKVLEYWGRTAMQVHQVPLFTALPEASGQGFEKLLANVYITGERLVANELPVTLKRNGVLETTWINFIYDPVRDVTGNIIGIIVVCTEVTGQVNARKKVEQAEESLRIATESADLGTWSYHAESGELAISPRFKEIFGFSPGASVSQEAKISAIHPDYQPIAIAALQSAIRTGEPVNLEYPLTESKDGRQRWVRAVGKRIQDDGSGVYVTGVVADITEQKRDEQRKNDFIGMVSHEMKTPLTSLSGYLQMLQENSKNEDAFTINMLGKANKQIIKITTLINGFLNVSRLESGKMQIDKQRFDMKQLTKEVEEESSSIYGSHRIVFQPCDTIYINADKDKIGQVISNLVSNAVKYSPVNTAIIIVCKAVNDTVIISVKDEGMGIKKENQPQLFDRYYRVSENSTTASGFGIGLYLCAEIIQRHNGKIWVESEVGKGSTFSFSLSVMQ